MNFKFNNLLLTLLFHCTALHNDELTSKRSTAWMVFVIIYCFRLMPVLSLTKGLSQVQMMNILNSISLQDKTVLLSKLYFFAISISGTGFLLIDT